MIVRSTYCYARTFSTKLAMTKDPFFEECLTPAGVYKFLKDNQWVESASGKSVNIINPTTSQSGGNLLFMTNLLHKRSLF